MARMVDQAITTYWWVSGDAGIANPDSPTAAALTAGKNITQYLAAATKAAAMK
jgi:hypothetical protein